MDAEYTMVSKANKLYVPTFAVLLIISATLLILAFSNYQVKQISDNYDAKDVNSNNSGDFIVYDEFDSDSSSLSDFFAKPDSLKIMKKTYQALLSNNNFNYCEFANQNIEYQGRLDISKEFVDNGDANLINQKDERGSFFTPLKSFQMDKKTFDHFQLGNKIIARNSQSLYENPSFIPVIIGDGYQAYFPVGTSFTGDYLGKISTYKVVGSLAPQASITINNESFLLDYYLIIPSINEQPEDDNAYLKRLYSVKCEGFIPYETEDEYSTVLASLNAIKEDTGFLFYVPNTEVSKKGSLIGILLFLTALLIYVVLTVLLNKLVYQRHLIEKWQLLIFQALTIVIAWLLSSVVSRTLGIYEINNTYIIALLIIVEIASLLFQKVDIHHE